jgi:endonuclease/exonuclease/phosphatase family metal-dependent hydrolase
VQTQDFLFDLLKTLNDQINGTDETELVYGFSDLGFAAQMNTLRVATYNIHKGVQGLGPAQRLEIHNLVHAVEQFDADLICLQEVRRHHHRLARRFAHWPRQSQAEYLLPEGYEAVYRTNALTRYG